MLLAVLTVEVEDGRIRLPRGWWPVTAVTSVALAGVTTAAFENGSIGQYVYDSSMALACGLFLSLLVLGGSTEQRRPVLVSWLEARPIVWVGLVSYSLFLWHEPIIWWLRDQGMLASSSSVAAFVRIWLSWGRCLWLSPVSRTGWWSSRPFDGKPEPGHATRMHRWCRRRPELHCRSSGPKDRRYHPETHQIGEPSHG